MDWTRGRTLGRGSAATVSLATCSSSGQTFAVKSAEVSRSENLRNEARILSTLHSPQVVGYTGCDVTREDGGLLFFNLLLEYAPCGSLSDVIKKLGRLEEAMIVHYAQQIVTGIDCLHSRGIVHCDLKPSNVLIGLGNCAKIADFGCAKRVEESTTTIGGTPMYMAPEVARGEEQGCPADVWALGCTVVEMATGKFPWAGVCDPVSAIHKIVYSDESPEIPSHLSPQAKDFLENCLRRDPRERGTTRQLLDHPFLDQPNHSHDFKQVEEFHFSPTSVMDREIWELAEVIGDATALPSCYGNSPDDRIEKLTIGGELPPRWSSDEDGWMDAREEEEERELTVGENDEERKDHADILVGVGSKRLLERVGICRDLSELTNFSRNSVHHRITFSSSSMNKIEELGFDEICDQIKRVRNGGLPNKCGDWREVGQV